MVIGIMSEPEQCIICLDSLPAQSSTKSKFVESLSSAPDAPPAIEDDGDYLNVVAALDGCEHIIHDACIRSWAQKTNTCPICRNPFHSVRVYNGVDGTAISIYTVQDKKQVAEFDVQQWLGENPENEEEEEANPCPICNSAEGEETLLLCDSCDAAYHTHCIGLDQIPEGDWYCLECAHLFQLTQEPEPYEPDDHSSRPQVVRRAMPRNSRGVHVRTRARLRRARRQARNAEWQGAWGQFSGRFYEMSELDLDNHDDEDEDLEHYRRFQQLDRRELQRWQQRINIAQRLGARDTFANNIPPQISEHLDSPPSPPPAPHITRESRDERRAWVALDMVRNSENSNVTGRKRKTRSTTASPVEPAQEPERRLKRPRTRRLPNTLGEASASVPPTAAAAAASSARTANGAPRNESPTIGPALVSSLLKELEPSGQSEDETNTNNFPQRAPLDASSPAISPSPSNQSSPRALSLTPPPFPRSNGRPSSPTLTLSTHIEPVYPPANYSPANFSPNRYNSDYSDTETRYNKQDSRSRELRQPRPRRSRQLPIRTADNSPTRLTMTQEDKKNINEIVRCALRPHWRAQKLTTEQYAAINRDISRKLYEEVKDITSLDDESRRSWEKRATQEVAQAVAELQA